MMVMMKLVALVCYMQAIIITIITVVCSKDHFVYDCIVERTSNNSNMSGYITSL